MDKIHNYKWTWKEFYPAALVWWNGTRKKKVFPPPQKIFNLLHSPTTAEAAAEANGRLESGHVLATLKYWVHHQLLFPIEGMHHQAAAEAAAVVEPLLLTFVLFLCSVCSWNIKENFFPFQS